MVELTGTRSHLEQHVDLADQRGGLALEGLHGAVIAVVLAALLLFEAGAVVANLYQLDDLSGRAALAAADAWRQTKAGPRVLGAVEGVVAGSAEIHGIDVSTAEGTVSVSLQRVPGVVVLDLVPAMRERITPTVTREVDLDPEGI